MRLSELLTPGRVHLDSGAHSKKGVLEELSAMLARDLPGKTPEEVFDSLIARERLGSTGLGHGVAIPHCRLPASDRTLAAVVHTEEGVDFDAIDNQPVDLFFALAVPEQSTDEHLQILASLAELLSDPGTVARLRALQRPEALVDELRSHEGG